MLNTVSIGDIGEAVAQMKFIKNGCVVSKPLTNNARYDFIVEISNKLYRVQVKTTDTVKDGKMEFATKTTNYSKGSWKSNAYSINEVDLFFFYCVENEWCGLYPITENMKQLTTLRISAPKNNQVKGITFASDYEFEKQFKLL